MRMFASRKTGGESGLTRKGWVLTRQHGKRIAKIG